LRDSLKQASLQYVLFGLAATNLFPQAGQYRARQEFTAKNIIARWNGQTSGVKSIG
jgi:hypothetical protein